MADPNEKPRIIIDDDWKEQARREKEEAEKKSQEEATHREIPEPSILELVQMIVMQVSVGLGGMQDPSTGQAIPPSLPLAKHYIDLLEVVQKKTQGNLDENEKRIIEGTLHELRAAFVQVVNELRAAAPPPAGRA